jgi:tRNA 2-thiocytidine biosynthesis protein TtcA
MLKLIEPTLSPPWNNKGKKIESMIRKALYEYAMLEKCDRLAIALSGGKDSITLLLMMKAILGRGFPHLELVAIHVAGAFSCGASVQEDYLHSICTTLGIPLVVCTSTQKLETLECYSCSRERRRLIFEAAKQAGAHTIAFGHHRDDNAQTLLLNLLHKGEFAGNLPKIEMVDYGVTLIRPLIYVSEHEIRYFAKESGFARITCQCPVGQNSMRKKVDRLLDELEELFPHARSNIAQAGLLYGSDKAQKRNE